MTRVFWQLRSLGRIPWFRKIVHAFFRAWYWDGRVVRICKGPLKGFKWQCRAGEQFFMPMGIYEVETASWLLDALKEDSVFMDIGANAGYFTLLAAKHLKKGQVIAFEPVPRSYESVVGKVRLNELQNVTVEWDAIGDRNLPEVEFEVEDVGANSHLAEVTPTHFEKKTPASKITVEMKRLDEYCRSKGIRPTVIKVDVEGGEIMILKGMGNLLSQNGPRMIISTHSAELKERCTRLLLKNGYAVSSLEGFDHELITAPQAQTA